MNVAGWIGAGLSLVGALLAWLSARQASLSAWEIASLNHEIAALDHEAEQFRADVAAVFAAMGDVATPGLGVRVGSAVATLRINPRTTGPLTLAASTMTQGVLKSFDDDNNTSERAAGAFNDVQNRAREVMESINAERAALLRARASVRRWPWSRSAPTGQGE